MRIAAFGEDGGRREGCESDDGGDDDVDLG